MKIKRLKELSGISLFLKVSIVMLLLGVIPFVVFSFWVFYKDPLFTFIYEDPFFLLLLLLSIVVLSFVAAYFVVLPIVRFERRLRGINCIEELTREAKRGDEIGTLAKTFQKLLFRLKRREEWYRRIVNETTEAILIIEDGRIVYANNAVSKIFGYLPQDVEGRRVKDFIDRDTISLFERREKDLEQGLVPFPMEIKIRRKDGREIWVEVETLPLNVGEWQAGLVILRDIDKRKKLLGDLERQNRHLSLLNRLHALTSTISSFDQAANLTLDLVLEEMGAQGGVILFSPIEEGHYGEKVYVKGIEKEQSKSFLKNISNFERPMKRNCGILRLCKRDYALSLPWEEVAIIPLTVSNICMGFLMVGYEKEVGIPIEDSFMLETIGRQIGLILEHKRLAGETTEKAKKLKELYGITLNLSNILNFDEVLSRGLKEFKEFLRADDVMAFRLDKNELRLVSSVGPEGKRLENVKIIKIRYPGRFKFYVGKDTFVMWRKDGEIPPRIRRLFEFFGAEVVFSSFVEIDADNLFLIVFSYRVFRSFSQDEIDVIKTGCLQFSTFLKTAWLFEKTREQNRILRALNDIFSEESKISTWNEFLRFVYSKVMELVPLDSFFIALYDPKRGVLRSEISIEKGNLLPPFEQNLDEQVGLSGYVFKSRRPLLVRDYLNEKDSLPVGSMIVGEVSRSLIYAPLWAGGKPIGIISVQSFEPERFNEDHLTLVSAIGFQLGLILEKAKINRVLQKTLSDLKKMIEEKESRLMIIKRLAEVKEEKDLFSTFLKELKKVIPYDHAVYYDLAMGRKPKVVFHHGLSQKELKLAEETALERFPGWVIKKRMPLLIRNTETVKRSRGFEKIGKKPGSVMYAPVISNGMVVGILGVGKLRKGAYSERDLEILLSFAHEAEYALQRLRLRRSLELQANELRILFEVTRAFLESGDFKTKLNKSMEEVIKLLKLDGAEARIYNESDNSLERLVGIGYLGKSLPKRVYLREDWSIDQLNSVLVLNKMGKEETRCVSPIKTPLRSYKAKTIVLLPLVNDIGVPEAIISLFGREEREFDKRELDLLESLRNVFSQAFQRWRLYREISDVKSFFETIVNNISDWILITNREGVIQFSNRKKVEGIFELSRGEKETVFDIFNRADVLPEEMERSWNSLWDRGFFNFVLRFKGVGGQRIFRVTGSLFRTDKKEVNALLFFHDVTYEKLLEEEEYTRSRLTMLGQLAMSVSHEVNDPLTAVVGYSDVLLNSDEIPDKLKKNLKRIKEAGQRVRSIVSTLQRIANTENTIFFNLNRVLLNLKTLLTPVFGKDDMFVEVSLPKESVIVIGSEDVFVQAILGIMDHIKSFMKRRKTKHLKLKVRKFASFATLTFNVADASNTNSLKGKEVNWEFESRSNLGLERTLNSLKKMGYTVLTNRVEEDGMMFKLKIPLASSMISRKNSKKFIESLIG